MSEDERLVVHFPPHDEPSAIGVADLGGGGACVLILRREGVDVHFRKLALDRAETRSLARELSKVVGWRRWFRPWPRVPVDDQLEQICRDWLASLEDDEEF